LAQRAEVAIAQIDVVDLRRPDDFPFTVARLDLVALGDVARSYPLGGNGIAEAKIASAKGVGYLARHVRERTKRMRNVVLAGDLMPEGSAAWLQSRLCEIRIARRRDVSATSQPC
jgi:hypothetical protein